MIRGNVAGFCISIYQITLFKKGYVVIFQIVCISKFTTLKFNNSASPSLKNIDCASVHNVMEEQILFIYRPSICSISQFESFDILSMLIRSNMFDNNCSLITCFKHCFTLLILLLIFQILLSHFRFRLVRMLRLVILAASPLVLWSR